jgi:hypothetical protein
MGVCACGQPIGIVPRACRIEDRALLWPPVRINADGSEHVCTRQRGRRSVRVIDPIPPAVQAALVNERAALDALAASQRTAASVTRLVDTLAEESEARQDYYRQRTGAGRPATREAPAQPQAPVATTQPAAKQEPAPSLADRLGLESEAG